MNVGEFTVALGVKGADKTLGALTGVKQGMGEVTSMSLEAKAAIIGAVYALERLMSHSSQTGQGLSNFNALTGMSTKQLQQWQYAAQQAGESSEEFTSSLKSVYDKMSQMHAGKGRPEGLDLVARTVGFDTQRAEKDTFYAMEQLQKFMHSNISQDLKNMVGKSFGLSDTTMAAMYKGVFNQQNFDRAPLYGDKEIGQLSKVDVLWKNLGQKVEMAFGHFTAAHGAQLVGDLSKVTDQVFRMINAFERLSEKLQLFKWVGKAFEGWATIFGGVAESVDRVGKNKGGAVEGMKKEGAAWLEGLSNFAKGLVETIQESAAPSVGGQNGEKTVVNNNATVNQHFQHDGKDHAKHRDASQKGITDAHKQFPANAGGF